MRKFLSWLLVFAMVISMAPAVFATESAKEEYVYDDAVTLALGDNSVTLNDTAYTTVFAFTPEETATYTFSVPAGYLLGYWGGSQHFMWDVTGDSKTTTLEQTITSVGQSVMVGITGEGSTTLTITKGSDYVEKTTTTVTYENKATLTKFEIPAGYEAGEYVDVTTSHTAVLGTDGYYHLDSVDGDILLVDMDYMFQLSEKLSSEIPTMYVYTYDEDGNTIKYDIEAAILAYEAVCDENMCYPLTEDLIFFYDDYAAGQSVYSWVLGSDYAEDTAWMYACMTMVEAPTAVSLNPGEAWTAADAWFAAYYWNGASGANGWVALTDADTDGIYEGEIPADYDNVIFTRMNPASTDLSWDNKWNQTVDLTVPTDGANLFTVENPWNESYSWNATGSWSSGQSGTLVGSGTEEDPYIITSLPYDIVVSFADETAADTGVYYLYTAEKDGNISIKDAADDFNACSLSVVSADWARLNESVTGHKVTAGEEVLLCAWATWAGDYDLTLQYGDESAVDTTAPQLQLRDNLVELPIDDLDGVTYTFTATETGTLYMVITELYCDYGDGEYVDNAIEEFSMYTELTVDGYYLEGGYYGSIEVVEGQTYTFTWNHGYWDSFGWAINLNLSYTDDLMPKQGGADLPYELYIYDCPTDSAEIAAGSTVYYNLYQFSGATFTVTGENAYVLLNTYDPMTYEEIWARYDAVDGVVSVPISGMGWGATVVQIGNDGAETATFGLGYYYPVGSMYNPEEISGEDTWTVEVGENSEGYYLNWTAEEEGLLTVTVNGESWSYCVNNMTTGVYGDYHSNEDDPVVSSETVPAWAGNVFEIVLNTLYDYDTGSSPAGTIEVTISFEPCTIIKGSEYDPYVFSKYGEPLPAEITVGAGEEVYVKLSYYNGTTVSFAGEGGYVVLDGVTYEAVNGVVELPVVDSTVLLLLGNSSDAEVTYSVTYAYPVGSNNNPEIITENGIYTTTAFAEGSYDMYYYQFTAPSLGTITVEVQNDSNWKINLWNKTTYDSINGNYNKSESKVFTMEVSAGDVVSIYGSTYDVDTYQTTEGTLSFNFTFEENTAEPGTEENPYSVHFADCYETPVDTVEIPAGSTVYYALKGFYGNVAVVAGEGAYILYNGETYTDTDGDGVIELVADDTTMLVQIGNSGDSAAVFTIGGEFPLGSGMNPEQIGEGQTVVEVEENDEYYYTSFTAECEGLVTVTVSGSDWTYMIYNFTTGQMFYEGEWTYMGDWTSCTSTEDSDTVTFDVLMGDEIQIVVNTVYTSDGWDDLYGSSAAGTIYIDLSVEYDHLDEDGDNCCDICGAELVTILLGDVNGDGDVDIFDANLVVAYYNEAINLTEDQLAAADVNGDGDVDIFDANLIVAYYNETINKFPAEK